MSKTTILPADNAFSDFIRERDGWKCQRCNKPYDKNDPDQRKGIHCSHFYSRGKWNTRFDPENCMALCYGCHRYMDKHIGEYETYKVEQLGQQAFDTLTVRAFSRSELGSNFWKKLSYKKAEAIFSQLA